MMAIESDRNNSLGRSGEGVIQPTSRKWLETAQQKDQTLVASIFAADCLTGRSRPPAADHDQSATDSVKLDYDIRHKRMAAITAIGHRVHEDWTATVHLWPVVQCCAEVDSDRRPSTTASV